MVFSPYRQYLIFNYNYYKSQKLLRAKCKNIFLYNKKINYNNSF